MSSSLTPLELIKETYPVLVFENKLGVSKTIVLNGNDVEARPFARVSIKSSELIQLPDFTVFTPVSPTLDEWISSGIFDKPKAVTAKQTPPVTTKPQSSNTYSGSTETKVSE